MRIQLFFPALLIVHAFAEPLPPVAFQGWENALRVGNDAVEVVAVPEIGRLVSIAFVGGENLLHFRRDLAGVLPPQDRETDWFNYGGDWMWPVHQDRWKDAGGQQWPPNRVMDGRPWSGLAWTEAGVGQILEMTLAYGEPLHLQVSRRVIVPEGTGAVFRVEQRITRTAPSEIPVCLWQISQMHGVDRAVLHVPESSAHPKGYRIIAFETPEDDLLERCGAGWLYRAGVRGEHKLGSDGDWIAAFRGTRGLRLAATGGHEGGAYPDGGCSVVLFSHAGLGYTEIETQSVERVLAVGESLENSVEYRLDALAHDPADCGTAEELPGKF